MSENSNTTENPANEEAEERLTSRGLFALDGVLKARIMKWASHKNAPADRLNGCDPTWFDGFCEGKIRELQTVREIIGDMQAGKDITWSNPDANA